VVGDVLGAEGGDVVDLAHLLRRRFRCVVDELDTATGLGTGWVVLSADVAGLFFVVWFVTPDAVALFVLVVTLFFLDV